MAKAFGFVLLVVLGLSSPSWAQGSNGSQMIDLSGPIQTAYQTILAAMQQAAPAAMGIGGVILGAGLVMKLFKMFTR